MTGSEGLTRLRQRLGLNYCVEWRASGPDGALERSLSFFLSFSLPLLLETQSKDNKPFYTQINYPTCINHDCKTR